MKFFVILALTLVSAASGTLVVSTTALSASATASLATGLLLAKGAVLAGAGLTAAAIAASRSRRSAASDLAEDDVLFNMIADREPAACIRRLICEISTGKLPASDNDAILNLFEDGEEVSEDSPKFDFDIAVRIGKKSVNLEKCQLRFTCPLNGFEMEALVAGN